MVYTERAEMAAVLCDTSCVSAVSTSPRWILKYRTNKTNKQEQKACFKKLVTHAESHASAVSLLESGEYKSDQEASKQTFVQLWSCECDRFCIN